MGAIRDIVGLYKDSGIQVAVVADGPYHEYFRYLVWLYGFQKHLEIRPFDEGLSRQGFSASDFMLMPSRYEPCGLPQMVSVIYGSFPIVHDTGGLHDTVRYLAEALSNGNGFVFNRYDVDAFMETIGSAMDFYKDQILTGRGTSAGS